MTPKHETAEGARSRRAADELRDRAAGLLPGLSDLYGRLIGRCDQPCACGACGLVGGSLEVLQEVARG